MLYFQNSSAYKNSLIFSPQIIKEKKMSSNSLAIWVTSGKKIVLFMKSYSMLWVFFIHVNQVNVQQGSF